MAYEIKTHGFRISATLVDKTDGESYDLSENLLRLTVRKRYFEDILPLFVMDFELTEEQRNRFRDDEYTIALRISYYLVDQDNQTSSDEIEIPEAEVIYDGTIRPYDSAYETTYSKKDEDSEEQTSQENAAPWISYKVSGIPENLIEMNSTTVNSVYKNANLVSILVRMLTENTAGVLCHIQQPTNTTVFDNILIPPLSLSQAISFLDEFYGFYQSAAKVFFDTNGIYIGESLGMSEQNGNILEYNIRSKASTSENMDLGKVSVDDETNNLKITAKTAPAVSVNKRIISHSTGSDPVFYSYDDDFDLIIHDSAKNADSYSKSRYFWNERFDSRFEKSSLVYGKASTSLSISLSNINPQLITPFTKLRVISQDYPELEGDYSIGGVSYVMSTGDRKNYSDTVLINSIKKVNS